MKKLIALLLLLSTMLISFTKDNTLHFNFTIEQTNYILNSLSKQPYNEAAPIIQSIQQQAAPQLTDSTTKKH